MDGRESRTETIDRKLAEVAGEFFERWPLEPATRLANLHKAVKDFPVHVIKQACDDLIHDTERPPFFPKSAELKKACQRYAPSPDDEAREFRCMHLDYSRPPLADDETERHWRCPATFPYVVGRLYCPKHEMLYVPGERATDAEIDQVFAEALSAHPDSAFLRSVAANRAQRVAAGESTTRASLRALFAEIGKTVPDQYDPPEVVSARKADQLRRAKEAGIL